MITKTAPCHVCGEPAELPISSIALIAGAICVPCAHKAEEDARVQAASAARDSAISRGLTRARSRICALAPSGVDPVEPIHGWEEVLLSAAQEGRGLVAMAPDVVSSDAVAWRFAWLAAQYDSRLAMGVGGGSEAVTLAMASKATFSSADALRASYSGKGYGAVVVSGVGRGSFLTANRRVDEWTLTVSSLRQYRAMPIVVCAGDAGFESDRWARLARWIGDPAMVILRSMVGGEVVSCPGA